MRIAQEMSTLEKLAILSDAAKYDVACTSSGVDRGGKAGSLGNALAPGICHSFSADGRCISLLKILYTNECIYNCSYCMNNCDHDVPRASFTPDEVCDLTMNFYRRNYIEGLFLSSGILVSPNHTMDLIYQTLFKLRYEHHFNGYIHVKSIPGADLSYTEKIGFLADRMSVNLELPTAESLKQLAPCKSRHTILRPMRLIQNGIVAGKQGLLPVQKWNTPGLSDRISIDEGQNRLLGSAQGDLGVGRIPLDASGSVPSSTGSFSVSSKYASTPFVPAGQSTQMIIGATPESDYQIMSVAEGLYQNFSMKRVFYSAFVNVNQNSNLPMLPSGPPLLREHRLYQADWLLRFYNFQVNELLSEDRPDFNLMLDPKCDWALRHLECFPMEINKADYSTLLRVPGIGYTSARRIVKARRQAMLRFEDLKKIGVVLKRAQYFITCGGRMMHPTKIEEDYICRNLLSDPTMLPKDIREGGYQQLSLFSNMGVA